jgi:hypothetical protein
MRGPRHCHAVLTCTNSVVQPGRHEADAGFCSSPIGVLCRRSTRAPRWRRCGCDALRAVGRCVAHASRDRGHVEGATGVDLDQWSEPERRVVGVVPELIRVSLLVEVPGVTLAAAFSIPGLDNLARASAANLDERRRQQLE